jgi:LysR family transcriptional regulator, hypochlorite-specific transcription factor HypT
VHLDRVYETDMAEGLKAMALEGHGIAFLPHSAVKKELRAKRLVAADSSGSEMQITMEIRAYREKPSLRESKENKNDGLRPVKRTAQMLWEYLVDSNKPSLGNATKSKA